MRKIITILLVLLGSTIFAQVKIGSAGSSNTNAVLELDGGTNKGLLLPRLSNTQITALTGAPDGLLIYNTTDNFLYVRKIGVWQKLTDATNGGGFSLPYSGTASTVGGAEFSITHTTTFGDVVYFNNTAGGAAVTTGDGHNKLNQTGGNTGIGLPAAFGNNPVLGKLVVRGTVGAVSAMFGDNTGGVSVMNNLPSIGFNYYYSAGGKAISTGFGSSLGQDQSTGRIYFTSSAASVTGAGTSMPQVERLVILANGNTGISAATPLATLQVGRGSTLGGTAQFDGTTYSSHFNYNATEETYIRGGKATSQVIINDQGTGNIRLAENGGNVGIGSINPAGKLEIRQVGTANALNVIQAGSGFSLYAQNTSATSTMFAYNAGTGPALITLGKVGINNTDPAFQLDVEGRMRLRKDPDGNTAGLWLDGPATEKRGFIGVLNENTIGFYGAGSGWSFLMDVNDGALMVGTSQKASGYKVNVAGKIIAEELRVSLVSSWPDYVFDKNYQLPTLENLEQFIQKNQHLPNFPAAKEVEKSGIAVGEMQTKMMEKIEELTLYVIQLKKDNTALKLSMDDLKNKMAE
jgi:hypothetical protein